MYKLNCVTKSGEKFSSFFNTDQDAFKYVDSIADNIRSWKLCPLLELDPIFSSSSDRTIWTNVVITSENKERVIKNELGNYEVYDYLKKNINPYETWEVRIRYLKNTH